MTETGFKIGPWSWDGPPDNIHVWQTGTDNRVCFLTSDGPTEANAHLIAAAPDLYEAMWQMLDDMGRDGTCCCSAAKEQALAAMAKARGEQS